MGKSFLFSDMEANKWVRLSEYFSSLEEAGPVFWDEQQFIFDVSAPNKHLVKYKVTCFRKEVSRRKRAFGIEYPKS